jgi:hypothetical protein
MGRNSLPILNTSTSPPPPPPPNPIRVIWAMALKDIKSSLTERAFMITSIIIPINFLLLFLLFALTGGQAPTAVVLKDNGPYAQQLLAAMEHSHSFVIQQTASRGYGAFPFFCNSTNYSF